MYRKLAQSNDNVLGYHVSGTITQQEVENYCNQPGYTGFGNNGSVRDYFFETSDGKLTYTNVVTSYYTAQNNRSYYTDPAVTYGT
jgi:M6 family metalloprotease-like protein